MLMFFLIVLTIYSLANVYIFFKGYYAIPAFQQNRLVYSIIFFSLSAIFIVAKILEARHSTVFSDVLNIIGGFWLAFFLYAFLFFLFADIIALVLRISGAIDPGEMPLFRHWSFIIIMTASVLLILGGFINAVIPVVREYDITLNKPAGEIKSLRIAAVSDIHLGSIIRKRSIRKLSAMLKDVKPDMVLLLGDIVDGEIGPVLRGDMLQYFNSPDCADGLFAVTGNHEFIGGGNRTIPYIESKGIRILKDEMITLAGGIQLIGRVDRDSHRFYHKERQSLEDLMKSADTSRPVILLDHQPYNLSETAKYGVDLQLSGHTHNGQMWPLNYITSMIYELSYGYMKKGNTNFIVSSGYGLWGPRVRSGSRSEVVVINLKFNGSASAGR